MSCLHMRLHRCFSIARITTIKACEGFFASVNQNMPFHISFHFHSFRTIWTPKKRWANSDRFGNLKNNQIKTLFICNNLNILKINSNAFYGCVLLEMCFDYKQKHNKDKKTVFLQCESRYAFSY